MGYLWLDQFEHRADLVHHRGKPPSLDIAYKLQAYAGRPRRKRSLGKATWPGAKQVFREIGAAGRIARDTIGRDTERLSGWRLLESVMSAGRRVTDAPTLEQIRAHAVDRLASLPEQCRSLAGPLPLTAVISDDLKRLADEADAAVQP